MGNILQNTSSLVAFDDLNAEKFISRVTSAFQSRLKSLDSIFSEDDWMEVVNEVFEYVYVRLASNNYKVLEVEFR